MRSYLRILALSLVIGSTVLPSSGCGGGGDGSEPLPSQEDPTLNPETDSTMQYN